MRFASKIATKEVRSRLTAQEWRQRRERLSRRLAGYTASAGAALAVAATAGPANATIIYDQGFTGPVTQSYQGSWYTTFNISGSVPAGCNFSLMRERWSTVRSANSFTGFRVQPNHGGSIHQWAVANNGSANGSVLAKNFAKNAVIGPGAQWKYAQAMLLDSNGAGSFLSIGKVKQGYLGIRFTNASGATEYGWVNIGADATSPSGEYWTVTIYGWAYDNSGAVN